MTEFSPPLYTELGPAPAGVCSRWLGDSPCGAAATHHVIWNYDMRNGAQCPRHAEEAREHWVFIGLHPYTAACAGPPGAFWLEAEDRCVIDEPPADHIARELGLSVAAVSYPSRTVA